MEVDCIIIIIITFVIVLQKCLMSSYLISKSVTSHHTSTEVECDSELAFGNEIYATYRANR